MASSGPLRDQFTEQAPSRYVVGIDLGTTNSAVTFVDSQQPNWDVRPFPIPQLVAAGQIEARGTLPSFHYQPAENELPDEALRLPWEKASAGYAVGFFGRDQGALAPGRLIASAKSWLCHTGVDRTAELLPWHGAADVQRLSPVEVAARYLQHIRAAWDAQHRGEPLAEQDIVLTLPASFDEVARELTVAAAAQAGLRRVVLIEEPQAAFYDWIYNHRDDWEQLVSPGQKILVCDIGGGTSDFTLIRVRRGEAGKIQFHRVAVGEHLILGGDNLDLALAHYLEPRLAAGDKLQPRQWGMLVRMCRQVKETLLGPDPPERLTVALPGSGSRLLGGGMQAELTRDEAREVLLEGFLPRVTLADAPRQRRSGFQEFGLPYAPDAAMTRYLAAFLTAHRHVSIDNEPEPTDHDPARPDIVLFNGGLFESPILRSRLLEVLSSWFPHADGTDWQPTVLENVRLDQAVARGASYYGMVRRGMGVRIAAGLARTYYVGLEAEQPTAMCLVPASAEPGQEIDLTSRTFDLRLSEPVEFPLWVSSTRLTDKPGELIPIEREHLTPLPPIRTVLQTRRRADSDTARVHLNARLTEIGTVELGCSDTEQDRGWRLVFDVRSATETDHQASETSGEAEGTIDEAVWRQCEQAVAAVFDANGDQKPQQLAKQLAALVGDRHEWPMTLLRRLWQLLIDLEPGRRKSQTHEARWLNLLGYSLRPGYGVAMDDWRVAETWRTLQGKVVHGTPACRNESWILWRRIAGGLPAGPQRSLADPLLASLRSLHRRTTTGRGQKGDASFAAQESTEMWRLLGSLELLPVHAKIELGEMLADFLPRKKLEPVRGALCWTLGRLGTRVPVYGPLNVVVPSEAAARWLKHLLEQRIDDPQLPLAVMQLARRTDDRYRDLGEKLRRQTIEWLTGREAPEHFVELIRDGGRLDEQEQGRVFGEQLPKGLRL